MTLSLTSCLQAALAIAIGGVVLLLVLGAVRNRRSRRNAAESTDVAQRMASSPPPAPPAPPLDSNAYEPANDGYGGQPPLLGMLPSKGADADMTGVLPRWGAAMRDLLDRTSRMVYVYNEPMRPALSAWNPLSWWSLADGRTPTDTVFGYDYVPAEQRVWQGPWPNDPATDGDGVRRPRLPPAFTQHDAAANPTSDDGDDKRGAAPAPQLTGTTLAPDAADCSQVAAVDVPQSAAMAAAEAAATVSGPPARDGPDDPSIVAAVMLDSRRALRDSLPGAPPRFDMSHLVHPLRAALPRSTAARYAAIGPLADTYTRRAEAAQTLPSDVVV